MAAELHVLVELVVDGRAKRFAQAVQPLSASVRDVPREVLVRASKRAAEGAWEEVGSPWSSLDTINPS